MVQFEIKNIYTFPSQITNVLEREVEKLLDKDEIKKEEYIEDYVASRTWNENARGELRILYEELWEEMKSFSIVGYHNTRLLNPASVYKKGLFFTEKKYFDQIENDMRVKGVAEQEIESIVKKVKHELEWRISDGNKHRVRSIDFVNSLDTTKKYEIYLAAYGGECFVRALHKGNPSETRKYKKILTMGKPYSVKFSVRFVDFNNAAKDKMVRRILEYGLKYYIKKNKEDISDDFTICREIRPEEITDVILNEVDFSLYYQSLFGDATD